MKKLTFLLFIIVGFSCDPVVDNSPENIDRVFDQSSFEIEIREYGCFTYYEEYFEVSRLNDGYKMISKTTGKSQIIPKMAMDSLKNYLKVNIGTDNQSICTFDEYIRVGSFFNSIDHHHFVCGSPNEMLLNTLLNYHQLAVFDASDILLRKTVPKTFSCGYFWKH